MSLSINTNSLALNAQRNLEKSQSTLSKSMERLSSGMRINHASDDAAGMAISSRMTTQINGLTQAAANANDGISLAQTTEGALAEVTNNLQRIRELAVQAANASNSASDRAALNQEVQARLEEINRIATQTSYNGQKVLNGTFGTATFQVGANVGESISVGLTGNMSTSSLGKTADYVDDSTEYDATTVQGKQGTGVAIATTTNALTAGELIITVGDNDAVTVGASQDWSDSGEGRDATSAYSKALAINSSGIEGLTATATTDVEIDWSDVAASSGYSLDLNGVTIYSSTDDALTADDVVTAINSNSDDTGVVATYDGDTGTITLSAADGRNIEITQTGSTTQGTGFTTTTSGSNNSTNDALDMSTASGTSSVTATFGGTIRLSAADEITVDGSNPSDIGYATSSLALGSDSLMSISVSTVADAETAILRVDSALTTVSEFASKLGAVQNRLESTISSVETSTENLTTARSRIQDADFASETTQMTSAQILQQAGISVLSQANSSQQNILKLLQ